MKITKAHLGVVVVFIAGIALGAIGARFCRMPFFDGRRGPPTREMLLDKITHELDLSKDQIEKIKPEVFAMHEKLEALRLDASPKIQEIIKTANLRIEPHLSEHQKDKLSEMSQRFLSRHQRPGPPQ